MAQSTDRPFLNRRAERSSGRKWCSTNRSATASAASPLDDTTWRVQGPDLAAGQKVRIIDADGAL